MRPLYVMGGAPILDPIGDWCVQTATSTPNMTQGVPIAAIGRMMHRPVDYPLGDETVDDRRGAVLRGVVHGDDLELQGHFPEPPHDRGERRLLVVGGDDDRQRGLAHGRSPMAMSDWPRRQGRKRSSRKTGTRAS